MNTVPLGRVNVDYSLPNMRYQNAEREVSVADVGQIDAGAVLLILLQVYCSLTLEQEQGL